MTRLPALREALLAAAQGRAEAAHAAREAGRGEAVRAEIVRAETVRAEGVRAEGVRAEGVRAEAVRAEAVRAEAVRVRAEAVRAEGVHALSVSALDARARAWRTIRRARRLPVFAAGLLAALLTAAVALAATGVIQVGAPVQPRPWEHFTPTTGYGVPIASTVRLLPISVPDPAGGPPWGVRYLQTTRGLGCLQVGRVLDGRLGVIGRDGTFEDDGRFHELPPDVFNPLSCDTLDARGHAFLGLTVRGLPASGADQQQRGCVPPGTQGATGAATLVGARQPVCPRADERLVSYGLLGPDARSLTYRVGVARRTIPVQGPLGAYLVVQPIFPANTPLGGLTQVALGAITPMVTPDSSPFTEVTYTGGTVCHIPPANRPGGARPCPLVGYVAPRSATPSAAQLASPVSASVGPVERIANPEYRSATSLVRRLHLTFTAPVAVANVDSRYLLELRPPTVGVSSSRSSSNHPGSIVEAIIGSPKAVFSSGLGSPRGAPAGGFFANLDRRARRHAHVLPKGAPAGGRSSNGLCARGFEHAIRVIPIERDVAVGERVHVGVSLEPACPGDWSGQVLYVSGAAGGQPQPLFLQDKLFLQDSVAMRAALRDGIHLRANPAVVGRFSIEIR